MAKHLGHGSPLGAFETWGGWLQRRTLGASSLSILNLKTFYPNGFPIAPADRETAQRESFGHGSSEPATDAPRVTGDSISNPVTEADPQKETTVARQPATPGSAPSLQPPSISTPDGQVNPFRANLQRYFTPEANRPEISSVVHNTVQPSTSQPSIAESNTSATLQAQESTAITDSSQSTQSPQELLSPSLDASTDRSQHDIQRSADEVGTYSSKPSAVELNTPAQQPLPGLASTNISQSIQSLRTPTISPSQETSQSAQSPSSKSPFIKSPIQRSTTEFTSPSTTASIAKPASLADAQSQSASPTQTDSHQTDPNLSTAPGSSTNVQAASISTPDGVSSQQAAEVFLPEMTPANASSLQRSTKIPENNSAIANHSAQRESDNSEVSNTSQLPNLSNPSTIQRTIADRSHFQPNTHNQTQVSNLNQDADNDADNIDTSNDVASASPNIQRSPTGQSSTSSAAHTPKRIELDASTNQTSHAVNTSEGGEIPSNQALSEASAAPSVLSSESTNTIQRSTEQISEHQAIPLLAESLESQGQKTSSETIQHRHNPSLGRESATAAQPSASQDFADAGVQKSSSSSDSSNISSISSSDVQRSPVNPMGIEPIQDLSMTQSVPDSGGAVQRTADLTQSATSALLTPNQLNTPQQSITQPIPHSSASNADNGIASPVSPSVTPSADDIQRQGTSQGAENFTEAAPQSPSTSSNADSQSPSAAQRSSLNSSDLDPIQDVSNTQPVFESAGQIQCAADLAQSGVSASLSPDQQDISQKPVTQPTLHSFASNSDNGVVSPVSPSVTPSTEAIQRQVTSQRAENFAEAETPGLSNSSGIDSPSLSAVQPPPRNPADIEPIQDVSPAQLVSEPAGPIQRTADSAQSATSVPLTSEQLNTSQQSATQSASHSSIPSTDNGVTSPISPSVAPSTDAIQRETSQGAENFTEATIQSPSASSNADIQSPSAVQRSSLDSPDLEPIQGVTTVQSVSESAGPIQRAADLSQPATSTSHSSDRQDTFQKSAIQPTFHSSVPNSDKGATSPTAPLDTSSTDAIQQQVTSQGAENLTKAGTPSPASFIEIGSTSPSVVQRPPLNPLNVGSIQDVSTVQSISESAGEVQRTADMAQPASSTSLNSDQQDISQKPDKKSVPNSRDEVDSFVAPIDSLPTEAIQRQVIGQGFENIPNANAQSFSSPSDIDSASLSAVQQSLLNPPNLETLQGVSNAQSVAESAGQIQRATDVTQSALSASLNPDQQDGFQQPVTRSAPNSSVPNLKDGVSSPASSLDASSTDDIQRRVTSQGPERFTEAGTPSLANPLGIDNTSPSAVQLPPLDPTDINLSRDVSTAQSVSEPSEPIQRTAEATQPAISASFNPESAVGAQGHSSDFTDAQLLSPTTSIEDATADNFTALSQAVSPQSSSVQRRLESPGANSPEENLSEVDSLGAISHGTESFGPNSAEPSGKNPSGIGLPGEVSSGTESQPSDNEPGSTSVASIQRMMTGESPPKPSSFPTDATESQSTISPKILPEISTTIGTSETPSETRPASSDSGEIQRLVDKGSTLPLTGKPAIGTTGLAIQRQTEANQSSPSASPTETNTSIASDEHKSLSSPTATESMPDLPNIQAGSKPTTAIQHLAESSATQRTDAFDRSSTTAPSRTVEVDLASSESNKIQRSSENDTSASQVVHTTTQANKHRSASQQAEALISEGQTSPGAVQRSVALGQSAGKLDAKKPDAVTEVKEQQPSTHDAGALDAIAPPPTVQPASTDDIQRTTTQTSSQRPVSQQTEAPTSQDRAVQRAVVSEQPAALAGQGSPKKNLPNTALGRPLPTVLKPLGVLRPLPSLESRSQSNSSSDSEKTNPVSANTQSPNPGTIQRQSVDGDIPGEWSNLESLVAGLTGRSQGGDNIQRQTPEINPDHHTDNQTVQRQGADGDAPSEWSNLEDLVTHLKGNTSDSASANTSNPQSSSLPETSPETKIDAKANDSNSSGPPPSDRASSRLSSTGSSSASPTTPPTQPAKPAALPVATIQRRVANPSLAAKPVFVQACQDTPTATMTSESDGEQADGIQEYSQYLELLAQEVYSLLRQRLSLEQERRGPKYPR